ncbi:MAG TPA: hypothetical protein VGQ39_08800 [Pyrinomonadaceae bacterium]|jgi:Tol biopolymer transport system component|nr:hypothetical protein [Pyrinomonadaceae bacterium]
MSADGRDKHQLASNAHALYGLSASPDGRHVVFSSDHGRFSIWRLSLQDGELKQLTNGNGEERRTWFYLTTSSKPAFPFSSYCVFPVAAILGPQASSPAIGASANPQQKLTSVGGTLAGEDACGPSIAARLIPSNY